MGTVTGREERIVLTQILGSLQEEGEENITTMSV